MNRFRFLFAAACLLAASCTSNIDVLLPRGPEGPKGDPGDDGKSAYLLWTEDVADGVDNPHTDAVDEWPREATSVRDYYDFLSGLDGDDGKDGAPAMGGGTGGGDGAPGKSAWELWVDDVTDADGLDNHHTPAIGDEWPRTETSLADFWRYLTGDDSSSSSVITEPGTGGTVINPIAGKPNVIAQYTNVTYSEYVDTETGGVTYQVYNDVQTAVGAGVVVSGLPGISGKSYTTDADGKFTVPAADLPTSGDVASRFGSATVDGAPSAINTYVPQRVETRLVVGTTSTPTPLLATSTTVALSGGIYMNVPVRAQRKMTSEGAWEDLPAYMTGIKRIIHAFGIKSNTMSEPDTAAPMLYQRDDGDPVDLSGAGVYVRRPTFQTDWMTQAQQASYYVLDGTQPEIFTMYMDDATQFYGQNPYTTTDVIWTLPVNFHPLPTKLVMSDWQSGGSLGTLLWESGSFNVDMYDPNDVFDEGNIVEAYRYVSKFVKSAPIDGVSAWERGADSNDNNCLGLMFKDGGNTAIGSSNLASLGDPDYTENQRVNVGSMVYLASTALLIAGPGNGTPIGQLISNPNLNWSVDGETEYIIRAQAPFTFPDIPIYADANDIP